MARLICAGLAVADNLLKPVDRNVFDLDSVVIDNVNMQTGGDALNATVNLTKLGMGREVKFVGLVGDDYFGRFIVDFVKQRGVDTSGISTTNEAGSAVCYILIESCGERHFVYHGGASLVIDEEYVLSKLDVDTEYLHIGSLMVHPRLEHEHLVRLFSAARDRGIKTSFDVTNDRSGEWFPRIEKGLAYTDTFFASYDEAVTLSGGLREPEAMAEFFGRYGAGSCVIKLGKDGCYATDYKQAVRMDTFSECPVLDTTGAGDAFVSGYLFGTLKGFNMAECCLLGNANGSMGVGAIGATAGTADLAQLKQFLREHGTKGVADAESLIARLG